MRAKPARERRPGVTRPATRGGVLKTKLDGKEEIRILLEKTFSEAAIAKVVRVSRTALHHFIQSRKPNAKSSKGETQGHRP